MTTKLSIKLTFLGMLWLTLASCNDPNLTQADTYRLGLQIGLGTNYGAWADFALGGRLGSCVLAKPPASDGSEVNPYNDKCEYYLRTSVTNSQGLKGYLGGVGCIPKAGSAMWGHTFLTKNQGSAPANIKNWVGQKISALVLNDTADTYCQLNTFLTGNQNRLALFDDIDFQTQAQLSHLVWVSPDVCAFRMPEMFPIWNSNTNSSQCFTPLLSGAGMAFCKIAYNRYINLNGGTPPTYITQSEFNAGTSYMSSGLVTNTDLVSTLHSKFMGIEAVPELTDAVLKNGDGSEWNGTQAANGADGFDNYSKNLIWSTFHNGFVLSPMSIKGIAASYFPPLLTQAIGQSGLSCAMGSWLQGWCVGHGPTKPLIHSDDASNPSRTAIVPPSITYNKPNLTDYNIATAPGIRGMPVDILNGLTVQYSYTSGHKLKSSTPSSYFYTARPVSSTSITCGIPVSWAGIGQLIPSLPETSLSNPLVTNPGNWQ